MCSELDFSNIFLAFRWRMVFMEERVKGRKESEVCLESDGPGMNPLGS